MSEEDERKSECTSDRETDQDQIEVVASVGRSCSDRIIGLTSEPEFDNEQSLRDYVASEGVEVQESDIFATQMLTDETCHCQNMNDLQYLEKEVLYEFPKENEEETCDSISQTYLDNRWYIPLEKVLESTDVSELRSLDNPLEKEMVKPKQVVPCEILQNKDGDFTPRKISKLSEIPCKVNSESGKKDMETDNKTMNKIYSNTEPEKHGVFLFGCRKENKNNSIYSSDSFTNFKDNAHETPSEALQFGCTNHEISDTSDSSESFSDIEDNAYDLLPTTMLFGPSKHDFNDTISSSDSCTDTDDNAHEFPPEAFLFGFQKRDCNGTMYSSDGFADIEDNIQETSSDNNEVECIINSNRRNIGSENSLFNIDPSQQMGRDYIFDRAIFKIKRKSQEFNSDQELKNARVSLPKQTTKRNERKPASDEENINSEASCSHATSKYRQASTGLTIKESNNGSKIFKSTMPTITETSEQEDVIGNKTYDSKASTSTSHKMKQNVSKKNKCAVCNVRLGLCAIRCRCGNFYCAKHRYDKEHDCTFDYRAMGVEEIRRNNPKVIAEKVRKL